MKILKTDKFPSHQDSSGTSNQDPLKQAKSQRSRKQATGKLKRENGAGPDQKPAPGIRELSEARSTFLLE